MTLHHTKEVKIKNSLGLHARPCAIFVKTASQFTSEIILEKNNEEVNGKSILGLLMLAAGQGSTLKITARGEDADAALKTLANLVEEDYEFNNT